MRGTTDTSANRAAGSDRPLSALLSQVLVAFTVELDNEFERRMGEAGYPGALLSLVVWSNLMRFLASGAVSARELAARAFAPPERNNSQLGCLERWVFVALRPDAGDDRPIPMHVRRLGRKELREGWGSGRGIRGEWLVHPTTKGRKALEIWPPLFDEIERRWQGRFGRDQMGRLRESLRTIVDKLDLELPHGLPAGWEMAKPETFPPRVTRDTARLSLSALISQLLQSFQIEFDRESRASLPLSANTLRILSEKPVPVADIPRLTGASPETSGLGWQIKPYVVVEADPAARRGKVVRLTPLGLKAQQKYHHLVGEIEQRWEAKFGKDEVRGLRESLHLLFSLRNEKGLLMSVGLVPPEGVVRGGHQAPALGRRDVGPAARQRMRDLVAQTEAFIRDPANTLPHFPLWDMNRGFGP